MDISVADAVNEITTGKKLSTRVSGGVRTKTVENIVEIC
jgi:hypothetical protein